MRHLRRARPAVVVLLGLLATFLPAASASAHVSVWPGRSAPGAYEHYVVYVPAEKRGVPTVELRLFVPPGVIVDVTQDVPGWRIETTVERGRISVLTWSGGRIAPNHYAAFGFAARNPRHGNSITWQAVQVYGDGSVVAWDGPAGSARPAAITVLRPAGGDATGTTAAPATSTLGAIALVISLLGLVCALTALGLLILVLRHRLLTWR